MTFQEAIQAIEEKENIDRYSRLKSVFEKRLKELGPEDFTERGICYYYLLRILLKGHLLFENEECLNYYSALNGAFCAQEKIYQKNPRKFNPSEIHDFYRLMERCYSSLEVIYDKKDFLEGVRRTFERKMDCRKKHLFFNRKYWRWFEYAFFNFSSRYGNSFLRWGVTSLIFAVVMAAGYYLLDRVQPDPSLWLVPSPTQLYDYLYFSIVVLTTLGLGDFVPMTEIGKVLVNVESFFGFVMLGVFINLLQKKL